MSKPKTYAILILDKSGSMHNVRERTLNDYNEKVQMYRNEANAGEQEVIACFITFNDHLDEHLWLVPAEQLKEGTLEDYVPDGGTALNDAIIYALDKAEETIRLGENDAVFVTILTDGDENSSKLYPRPKGDMVVKQRIKHLEEPRNGKQQWTITYVGANQDVEEVAERYGIQHANCAVYNSRDAKSAGVAYDHYNARVKKFLRARVQGVTASKNFTSDVDGEVADWRDK